jgi:hypothetical protein
MRIGGVGGDRLHLKIGADGRADLDGFAFTLAEDEREGLAAAADGVDFAANAGHDRGDGHPDAYLYDLRVGDIPVLEDDDDIPTPVGRVINALERIAANHSAARRELEEEARDQLVVMLRDGGVGAQHIELWIAPDGTARASFGNPPGQGADVRRFVVPDDLLDAVKRALPSDPDDLRSHRDPNVVVADGFEYVLITGGETITAGDPVENDRLEQLLQALEQVLEFAH